jgi:predicted methyltransferase
MKHRHIMIAAATLAALATSSGATSAGAADNIPASVNAAVQNPERPASEIAQDKVLKPAETLVFSGVKPGQAVADLLPESGYYTRLFSGAVGAKGRVYGVIPRQGNGAVAAGPAIKDPSLNTPMNRVQRTYVLEDAPGFKNIQIYWEAMTGACGNCAAAANNAAIGAFSVPEQLDVVVAAQAYHVLKGAEFAKLDIGELDKAIYRALKSGGVFLVIDNAADKGAAFPAAAALNRADEDAVKAEVTAAGFQLDGESQMLMRGAGADDHSKAAADVLVTRGAAPADMFVLRFKKPANAPNTDQRPAKPMVAMAPYFGNTRANDVGARGNRAGQREHRTFFHEDGTYQEIGRADSGNNVFASGTWFFDADGRQCRHHLYQPDARDMADCNGGAERLDHKVGDKWMEDDGKTPVELMKGYVYFDE